MALTVQQLQANLDAINQALGNPTLKVRFPDGREVTGRSVDDLRKAKAEIEEALRVAFLLAGMPAYVYGKAQLDEVIKK